MSTPGRAGNKEFTNGTSLILLVSFGAVVLVAIFASKIGGSSVFFFVPMVFVTAGMVLWMRNRRDDHSVHKPSLLGAAVLVGCGVVVAACGFVGGALLEL